MKIFVQGRITCIYVFRSGNFFFRLWKLLFRLRSILFRLWKLFFRLRSFLFWLGNSIFRLLRLAGLIWLHSPCGVGKLKHFFCKTLNIVCSPISTHILRNNFAGGVFSVGHIFFAYMLEPAAHCFARSFPDPSFFFVGPNRA